MRRRLIHLQAGTFYGFSYTIADFLDAHCEVIMHLDENNDNYEDIALAVIRVFSKFQKELDLPLTEISLAQRDFVNSLYNRGRLKPPEDELDQLNSPFQVNVDYSADQLNAIIHEIEEYLINNKYIDENYANKLCNNIREKVMNYLDSAAENNREQRRPLNPWEPGYGDLDDSEPLPLN